MNRFRSAFGTRNTAQPVRGQPEATPSGSSTTTTDQRVPHHPASSDHGRSRHRARESTYGRGHDKPLTFSQYSTPAIPDSMWFASDFMIGAGMVIIQPSSGKVVLLYESKRRYWFLPKGRKDRGESLEQTALREAYEESGYRVDFLPVFLPTNAPRAPSAPDRTRLLPCTEPFYVSTQMWPRRQPRSRPGDGGGEYLMFWYLGQIQENAVHEADTGMADEKDYQTYILDIDEACRLLDEGGMQSHSTLLHIGYQLWQQTEEFMRASSETDLSGTQERSPRQD